jgi:PiT family inorganic phosphate transporter
MRCSGGPLAFEKSMIVGLLVLSTLLVAYANGANDNIKGVATLYGSSTLDFRTALWLGTIATFAGCVCSVFLAEALVEVFSGKGVVPDTVSASPHFLLAVAFGAAATVMLASVTGFPVSTTHALTGALVGAGFVAAGDALNLRLLGGTFFLSLLVSPLLSMLLTMPLYKLASAATARFGVEKESCVCVGARQFIPVRSLAYDARSMSYARPPTMAGGLAVTVGTTKDCVQKYNGQVFGVTAQSVVNGVHYLSGAAVSFARGLNDTPKLVGLLLVAQALDLRISMLAIALAMGLGGLINARKVAETMSKKISGMNDGQALTANLVTAVMVIGASRLGVPVSTTHVSVGAISGVGIVKGTANLGVIGTILLSWVLTLPVAAVLAAATFASLRTFSL